MSSYIGPVRQVTSALKETMKLLLSDPEGEKMVYFRSILDELKQIAHSYQNHFGELQESVRSKIAGTSLADGGDCIHRGILCPSPILNILAGCNQGKTVLSRDEITGNYYEYQYDEGDNLLAALHYDTAVSMTEPDYVEFILRRNEVEYGITYHQGWSEVSHISKTVFLDGQIQNYAAANYDEAHPDEMFLHYEEFQYANDVPVQVDVYFGISPELNMYEQDTFQIFFENAPGLAKNEKFNAGSVEFRLTRDPEAR